MTTLAFSENSAGASQASGGIASFIPLIIIFLIAYLFYKNIKNKSKYLPKNPKPSGSNVGSGWKFDKILIVISVLGLLFAFSMDTSVPTEAGHRVNNLGLMNDKQNYLIISGILLYIGVMLNISNKNKANHGSSVASNIDENDYKTCPYCAERIKYQAKICRFCSKELEIK